MNRILEAWLCLCALSFVTAKHLAQVDQSSDEISRDDADDKRGWQMQRLGRGLQMLRLGKRTPTSESFGFGRRGRSLDGTENSRLSSSDIQAVLDTIFDEPRDESRRQPPLPRYGRDSSSNSRYLVDANSGDIGAYSFERFPISNSRSFFRPAPRGGRYKRSLPTGRFTYFLQDDVSRARTIPTFGHLMDELANIQPQAVSRPVIGSYQIDDADESSQIQSA